MLNVKRILLDENNTTFETDNLVVPKLAGLELDRYLSKDSVEKPSLDSESSTGVGPNIAVRNRSASESDGRYH